MIIHTEEIFSMQKLRQKINSLPLKDIELRYNGEKIKVNKNGIKEWELIGLTNIDFINTYEESIKTKLTAGEIKYKIWNPHENTVIQ